MNINRTARTTAVVAGLALSSVASAQNFDWLNPIDGDWDNMLLWSPNGVPNGPGATATIAAAGAAYTVNMDTVTELDELLVNSADATLLIARDLTVNTSGLLRTGSILLNGRTILGGTFTNQDQFTVRGNSTFDLASFTNEAMFDIMGVPGLSATLNLGATPMTNSVTGTMALDSSVGANGAATLNGTTLINDGIFETRVGSGTSRTVRVDDFQNNATVNIQTNTTFNGNGDILTNNAGATFNTSAGALAAFSSGSSFENNGGTINNSGDLRLSGASTQFTANGGAITGNAIVLNGSVLNIDGATTGAVHLNGAVAVNAAAASQLDITALGIPGSSAVVNLGAMTLTNNATFTMDSTAGANGAAFLNGTQFINNGTFSTLVGSGTGRTVRIDDFQNNGIIDLQATTLFNSNGDLMTLNNASDLNIAASGSALFSGGSSMVMNTGATVNNLGTLRFSGASTFLTVAGTLTGNAVEVNGSTLNLNSATTGAVHLNGAVAVNAAAASQLDITALGIPGSSAVVNLGAMTLTNNATFTMDSTAGANGVATLNGTQFVNNGTFSSLVGSGSARTVRVDDFQNNSIANFAATTRFDGNGDVMTNAVGATLSTGAGESTTFSGGSSLVNNGAVINNMGQLIVSGGTSQFTFNGGAINGNAIEVRGARLATTAAGSGSIFATGSSTLLSDLAAGLTVDVAGVPGSSAILNYGAMATANNAVLRLTSTPAANGVATFRGTGDFTNNNTLVILEGSGTARTVDTGNFNNAGSFDANASVTVRINSGTLLNTGEIFIAPGAVVTINGSGVQTFDNNANGLVQGGGTLSLLSVETFINDGVFDPQGDLDILGDWHQTALADLAIELGGLNMGVNYDVLAITLDAALDGDLLVTLANGFTPGIADVFTILTADSVTGVFANGVMTVNAADGSGTFDVLYNADSVQLTNFVPVPAPASVTLLGLVGIAASRRRRA